MAIEDKIRLNEQKEENVKLGFSCGTDVPWMKGQALTEH